MDQAPAIPYWRWGPAFLYRVQRQALLEYLGHAGPYYYYSRKWSSVSIIQQPIHENSGIPLGRIIMKKLTPFTVTTKWNMIRNRRLATLDYPPTLDHLLCGFQLFIIPDQQWYIPDYAQPLLPMRGGNGYVSGDLPVPQFPIRRGNSLWDNYYWKGRIRFRLKWYRGISQ